MNKQKIAFCLHGLASGVNFKAGGLPVTFEEEFNLYKKNFIGVNEGADIFFHTWNNDDIDKIVELYRPNGYSIEDAKVFKKTGFKGYLESFKRMLFGNPSEPSRMNNIYSRWYSLSKAINCALEYEKESCSLYDYFFISRFDMSLMSPLIVGNNRAVVGDWRKFVTDDGVILKDEEFFSYDRMYKRLKKGFPHDDEGLSDLWFLVDRDVALTLKTTFDELNYIIKITGLSNHKILEYQLRNVLECDDICKELEFGKDYALTRWLL